MKKIIVLMLLLTLTSCFGWFSSENTSSSNENTLLKQNMGNFSLSIPNTWKTIPLSDIPVPKTGEVVYAVSSTEQRQGYLNNIVVVQAENTLKESSQALMKNTQNLLKSNLESYALLEEQDFSFDDGEASILLTFLGKYNSQTPEITYLQTARACGTKNYFLTLSLAEKLEDYSRYAALLKTFSCEEE